MKEAEKLVKAMGLTKAPPYYFVSHASLDNARIRPIILGLLDAGIPLFFDRPHDIGVSPRRFVGKIKKGTDWTQSLNVALERARGCLWFPSEAYANSEECARECALANYFDDRSGYDYDLISIFVDEDAPNFLTVHTQTKHGVKIHVEAAEESYRICRDSEDAAIGFFEDLSDSLTDFVKSVGQETQTAYGYSKNDQDLLSPEHADDGVRDYSVPFRINRHPQRADIRSVFEAFRDAAADRDSEVPVSRNRRPIIICHGLDNDKSRRFTQTTIAERIVNMDHVNFRWAPETAKELKLGWPASDITNQRAFDKHATRALNDQFLGSRFTRRGTSQRKQLAGAFGRYDVTRLIVSRINLTNADLMTLTFDELRDRLNAWIGYWNGFPFDLADQQSFFTIVPILDIVYPLSAIQRKTFAFRKPAALRLRNLLSEQNAGAALMPQDSKVNVQVLKTFQKIRASTIENWVHEDDEDLFRRLSLGEKEKLTKKLKAAVADQPDGVRMHEWFKRSEKILYDEQIGR